MPPPTPNATPSTVQDVIASGQRYVTLGPGAYDEIRVNRPIALAGTPGATVHRFSTAGYTEGIELHNLAVGAGGVQIIDGVKSVLLDGVTVEGDGTGAGINITGYDTSPCFNVSISRTRVRNVEFGLMLGQNVRYTLTDLWFDRCQLPSAPSDPSRHAAYLNDDNCIGGDIHGMLATRCGGTSYRGTGSRAYDVIAYQCGGSLAGSKNAEQMTRFTSLDAGPIEIGAQGPCVVEDPYGGIQIKSTCRSPWLQIYRPRYGPGQGITGDSIYAPPGLPNQDVRDRFGTLTVVDPQSIAALTRTPESFCRDVLDGEATLESLWTKPLGGEFTIPKLNQYVRGGCSPCSAECDRPPTW